MIAKISHGGGLRGALEYNQQKVDKEKAKILECNKLIIPAAGCFTAAGCVRDFERFMPSQITISKPSTHISISPHPDDKLSDEQMAEIGRLYLERMGYGEQPYIIFKHEDIDRHHLHIVTTRVRPDGPPVSDRFENERSTRIVEKLEAEFGLVPAKGRRQGEAWQLKPVDAATGNIKRQVANVIKPLAEMYRFRSISEYRALLSLYNVGVEKVEGENKGHRYTGLVYSALDGDGNRVGQPLKSSLFGRKYGIEGLERVMDKSQMAVKADGAAAKTKGVVSAAMSGSRDGSRFMAALRGKGIDLVMRYNDGGRLYGVTFIDHNSRTVLNGSALGKEFSANALAARFPDLATESRENRQPIGNIQTAQGAPMREDAIPVGGNVQSTPAPEPSRRVFDYSESVSGATYEPSGPTPQSAGTGGVQTTQSTPATGNGNTTHQHGVGVPSVGGLLSILAPEPGGSSGGGTSARQPKKKKKKRRYGRQV